MDQESVDKAIEKVRQGLKNEGGDIEVVSIKDDILYVRLKGACETCPMSTLTIKNWVEKTLLEEIPSLKGVKAI